MNENLDKNERTQFKNWIKKRFINEVDAYNLPPKEVFLWSMALRELSNELIRTQTFSHIGTHHIVPFCRGKRD